MFQTHVEREQAVLSDLEESFPGFGHTGHLWSPVPDGHDPPDFLSSSATGKVGLELVEWLDGRQMGPAKAREAQRRNIRRVLGDRWESRYAPKNFHSAIVTPKWELRIARSDEEPLRNEFATYAEH